MVSDEKKVEMVSDKSSCKNRYFAGVLTQLCRQDVFAKPHPHLFMVYCPDLPFAL